MCLPADPRRHVVTAGLGLLGPLHGSVQWQRWAWKAELTTRSTAASAGFVCSGKQAKLCAAVESGYSHSAIKGGDAFGFRVGAGCNELLR